MKKIKYKCKLKNPTISCTGASQQIRICWHANQLIDSKHLQRFPEPSKLSQFGLLGYTIMVKTADLTVVQKTIIDTLHKESKPQTFIAKEAVHRVLYPSMLTESWVEGKRCTTNRGNRSLMRIVKQNQFKNLGELHKLWTEAGVKASRAPHTDVSRSLATVIIRGVLPGLMRRRTGLLPSDPKSSFQMRASFVFHLETRVLESGGRVEKLILLKLLQSVCIEFI